MKQVNCFCINFVGLRVIIIKRSFGCERKDWVLWGLDFGKYG